jgi:anti-sigma-K factor RskA
MLLYVTDGLEPSEQQELRAHLAGGCPACAGALAEAQATVPHLPMTLPRSTPPASARDKLLSRVAADVSLQMKSPVRHLMWPRLAVAACLGALFASALFWMTTGREFNPARSPDLQFVKLTGGEPQPKAHGRIFWDRVNNNWHVQVFDLKPPPAGRTYELWFITPDQKKVPGPTFTVDERGRGNLVAAVPKDIGAIALAAVTDEPAGGVPAPTGQVQLVGDAK